MRRLKKKFNASSVDKAPENGAAAAAETSVVLVNTEVTTEEVTTEKVECTVVSQTEHHNDTPNGTEHLKDDAVGVPTDGVNVLDCDEASGKEMRNEVDPEGVPSGNDGDTSVNNEDGSKGEGEGEDNDHDEEGEEDVEDLEDENVDDDDDEELENENPKGDAEMENVNKEEVVVDLKVANDESDQVNTGKEEFKEDDTEKEGAEKVNIKKEEVVKEDNTPKTGVKGQRRRLKKKGSPAGNMKCENKISEGASGQQNITADHKGGHSNSEAVKVGEADIGKEKEKIDGVQGDSSNQKRKKSKKRKRKKNLEGGPNKEVNKQEENQETLPLGKSNKAKSMGMIFICNTKTKSDCFRYKVLGLPAGKKDTVEKIYKGMRLFLYDVDLKLLYGIFKAAAPGGYNIHPKAFNSKFPSQVQYTVLDDCPPLPEEQFKKALSYTKKKFDTLLTSKQVKDLCTLFTSSKKNGSKRLDRGVGKRKPRDRDEGVVRYPRYERERVVMVPQVRAPARLPHLPPRAAAAAPPPPPYAYDGYRREALDHPYRQPVLGRRDDYRQPVLGRRDDYRQPLLARRDDYRQQPLLLEDHSAPYREDMVVQRHELRSVDGYRRAEPLIEYRGGGGGGLYASENLVRGADPYSSYSYRERAEPNGLYGEHDGGYADYRSVRPRYGYY